MREQYFFFTITSCRDEFERFRSDRFRHLTTEWTKKSWQEMRSHNVGFRN